ncbi:MAG: hypothetical protein GX456_06890 [Verrucomicrobia bacterium]|nr:hypothetical protein [Verrucomicrobiota bacterium]
MSVLGLAWDKNGICLTCRPDPALPPRRLDELCHCEIPRSVRVPPDLSPEGNLAGHVLLGNWFAPPPNRSPREQALLASAVAEYFGNVLSALQNDPDAQVLLLDSIDQLVIVTPPHAHQQDVDALAKMLPATGLTITMVTHYAAQFAGLCKEFLPMKPFLVCEWDEDLVFHPVVAHPTLSHVSRTGQGSKLKHVGARRMQELLTRHVVARHPALFSDEAAAGKVSSMAALRAAADAFVQKALAGGELAFAAGGPKEPVTARFTASVRTLPPGRPHPTNGTRPEGSSSIPESLRAEPSGEPWAISLTEDEVLASWKPLLDQVRNFSGAAAREARAMGLTACVCSGAMFQAPVFASIVHDAFEREGVLVSTDSPTVTAGRGAHFCVRARPMLSYDCGVLIKLRGARTGIGTLVLVRPAAVGEKRQSDVLALPIPNAGGALLDLAIYLRRLDEQATSVVCEVLKSHTFSPALSTDRQARLQVSMRVDEDEVLGATVSVDIHDLNSDDHIRFNKLPLRGTEPLSEPPLRDPQQLMAADWANRIDAIRRSPSGSRVRTVSDWRARFEDWGGVSRGFYASYILNSAVEFITILAAACNEGQEELLEGLALLGAIQLSDPNFVRNAHPEEFQAEARLALFEAMRRGATALTGLGCNYCAAWLEEFREASDAPTEERCAQRLLNAVSQDLAGREIESAVVEATSKVAQMYHWTCQHPSTLNVAWDGSLD